MTITTSRFAGFQPEAIQFLLELAVNNDRSWFQPQPAARVRSSSRFRSGTLRVIAAAR